LLMCGTLGVLHGCGTGSAPTGATSSGSSQTNAAVTAPVVSKDAVPTTAPVEPVPAKPPLQISPASLTFGPGDAGAQMIARVQADNGAWRDLTAKVAWKAEPEGVVSVDAGGYVRPVAPGKVAIRAVLEDRQAESSANVETGADRAWNFGQDIVPILTR